MTPESHTHAEVHRTGHRWLDMIVAGCALLVSVTSLVVAIFHGRTMERMADANARLVAANSWPLLQRYWSDRGRDGGPATALVVANGGVGPAKIEAFELFWKGRPMHNPSELIEACCLAVEAPDATSSGTQRGPGGAVPPLGTDSVQGIILRAGTTLRPYEIVESPVTEAVVTRLRATKADVTLRACYCSVFDECWVSDLRTLQPARVRRCEAPKVPFEP